MRSRVAVVRLAIACFAISALLVQFADVVAGAEAEGNVLAEFTFDGYSGILPVPVTFNGIAYNFWIDTGSAYTNVTSQLSSLLVRHPRSMQFADTARTVTRPVYRLREGRIGSLALPRLDSVSCTDEYLNQLSPLKVYGLLGMDALRTFILQIDYDRGKISFLRSVPRGAGVRVQLDKPLVCPSIKGAVGGRTRPFILDTGCLLFGAGSMAKRDFNDLVARRELLMVGKMQTWSASSLEENRAGLVRPPISVAGRQFAGLAFVEIGNERVAENMLGAGFLRRYVVTFDFPHHAVYLLPGPNCRQIDASHDSGGFRLRRDANRILVSAVGWRSPAFDAGVQVNDVLTEIDGKEANQLDDVALARLLSRSGQPISLVFRRTRDGGMIRFVYDEHAIRAGVRGRLNISSAKRGETVTEEASGVGAGGNMHRRAE